MQHIKDIIKLNFDWKECKNCNRGVLTSLLTNNKCTDEEECMQYSLDNWCKGEY
jgi:hypothetical protein